MSDQEFLELVWEDGQLLMRRFPKRIQNNPSSIDHPSHASNIANEQNRREPIFSPKKRRFATGDSLLENPHHDNKKDLNLIFTHNSSPQDNKDHESLPELYQTHFDLFRGNSSHDKLLKDSQVVPVNECANLKTCFASNYCEEIPQVAAPSNISRPADSSFLQHYQALVPSKRPRVKSSPKLVSLGELANSKLKERGIEPDAKKETVNFSLFSTSLAFPTSSRGFSRAEDLKNNAKTTSGPGSNDPVELMLIATVNGSKGAKGLQNQPSLIGTNAEFLAPVDNPPDKSLPDAQSEAISRQDPFTNKISPDQVYGQNSRLPENCAVKGKLDNKKSTEPPAASSSSCSRGDSNNPTFSLKRINEDTEVSAHLSDENEEEEERVIKTVPGRRSKINRKRRTAEVHNLYERRRRDRINKKMRALKELIPNCNVMDKASLLDEAIEYVKTLQLRLQMLSMGNGVCMPLPIMLPPGMQAMHAPQITHFSPMSMGMNMRIPMGVGCNLSQFLMSPIPGTTSVAGIAETRFPMPGFPSQPLPTSILRAPLMGLMHKTVPVPGVFRVAASTELTGSASCRNQRVRSIT